MHNIVGDPDRVHLQNMEQLHLHAYDCNQNVTEPQATKKSHEIYTCVQACAPRLVQNRLQVVQMAWTDDSTLAIFFYMI